MGRKTNSVSLRLKKTNRDFNDCWYGDILYSENLSKSLKIKGMLSQTLKSAAVPCAHLSFIGAFKKSNIFVGYLDPETTRKQRCESLYLKMYPRLPDNRGISSTGVLSKHSLSNKQSYKGSKSCKTRPLQAIMPNIVAPFAAKEIKEGQPVDGQIQSFSPIFAHNAPLGLVFSCLEGNTSVKQSREIALPLRSFCGATTAPISPTSGPTCPTSSAPLVHYPTGSSSRVVAQQVALKLYKSLSTFPQKTFPPEKFLSIFSKTTQLCCVVHQRCTPKVHSKGVQQRCTTQHSKGAQQARKKVMPPIYNFFPLMELLYIFKHKHLKKEEKQVGCVANKSFIWFSQRKSFFCATETSKDPNLAVYSEPNYQEKQDKKNPLLPYGSHLLASETYPGFF